MRTSARLLLLALLLARPAAAQKPADPYRLVVVTRPSPYGGYYSGLADLIRAPADRDLTYQKAAQEREATRQKKLQTRRKELDQIRWERDWQWKMLDEQQDRIVEHERKRALERPALTEVLSGASLNVLLKDLSRESLSSDGTSVPVQPAWLDSVNLVGGGHSVGMLRQKELPWTAMLQADELDDVRTRIEDQLDRARKELSSKKVPGKTIEQLDALLIDLNDRFEASVGRKRVWSPAHSIRARAFIRELKTSVAALNNPKEAAFLIGARPSSRNVVELVQYLRENGLRFGPASTGGERHYLALHDAFVQEVRSRDGQKGFGK